MNAKCKMSWRQDLLWDGWEAYFKFWDEFVKKWFNCKRENPAALPDDALTRCLGPLFNENNINVRLSKDELPEPYCIDPGGVGIGKSFDPAKVGLVVIQMNPAAAAGDLEATKYYSHKDRDDGFLIRDFANEDTCKKEFSKWIERWSCLKSDYPKVGKVPPDESEVSGVPAMMVCGHAWWHDNNRKDWFKSFGECGLNKVFAFEMIPYHSQNFVIRNALNYDGFKAYLLRHVLLPAGICAQSAHSKVVVCCGDGLRQFLTNLGCASKIFTWEADDGRLNVEKDYKESLEKRWPKNDGRYTKRWYELYCCNLPYSDGSGCKDCKFLILSIYANQMNFPGANFRGNGGVEELLKERIKKVVMDLSPETHSNGDVKLLATTLTTEAKPQAKSCPAGNGNVANANIAFWEAFKKWCEAKKCEWCSAAVAERGNSYYDPQGGGKCHLFFTIGNRSGSIKQEGPLVTVGIYCAEGERRRKEIKGWLNEFDEAFKDYPFDFQDWTSGNGVARRILFVRRRDCRQQTDELFQRMADDYERIREIMKRHKLLG